jgi:VWFA-related protein
MLCALLLTAGAAHAQLHETVNVNLVEVPVTVIDSAGNPVRGLTAANFELYDAGQKRTISSFDTFDYAAPAADKSALAPLNPAARRSFLLLFDLGFSSPKALQRAQDAARRFIKEGVQPLDLVGVGTIDVNHGFRLITAFTTDRELVGSAIADPVAFRGNDPLQIANQTRIYDVDPGGAGSASTRTASGPAAARASEADEQQREIAAMVQKENEPYVRARIEKQVDALGQLARMLRAVPGRKQVVFLSEGFDARYLQGRDARASSDTAKENDAVLNGEYWHVDNDARFGNSGSLTILDRMTQYFRQSDVVLHAIDIQGVRVQNDLQNGATINSNAGLFVLARPTGGDVFQNSNDLKGNFGRMLHRQEVVYILGFQAPESRPGKFHDLKIKLVNASGRVSHRAGYFENGAESVAERALTSAEVIVNDVPQDDIRVTAFAAPFPTGSAIAQVPVILELNGTDLAREAHGGPVAASEIFVYAFDSDGVVRDRLYQRISVDLKRLGDKLRGAGVRYYGTLMLPPGNYAIKSLVRPVDPDRKPAATDSEKRGYARVDVTVPNAGELAVLPPIPIDEQPKWILVKAADRRVAVPYPFELNGQEFIPGANVKRGESRKLAVVIFGAKADELTWQTTPKTTMLGSVPAMGATKFVLQIDDPKADRLDITVHRKGVAEPQTASVAIARP